MNLVLSSRVRKKREASGLTLMEMLVAASLWMFSARSFIALGNYGDLDRASRNALDNMSREIRQTKGLTAFTPTSITLKDWDDGALTYAYDSSARTLTRQKSGVSTLLLGQCDYLNFDIS